jgi:FAD/FMN-containing dehydrogenase
VLYFIQIGASNIGTTGFTIDMQKMNQITLASNKSMVSLGPGSSWGQVYAKLDPLGVTALGGRTSGVGVGGLLLGGNYFSARF